MHRYAPLYFIILWILLADRNREQILGLRFLELFHVLNGILYTFFFSQIISKRSFKDFSSHSYWCPLLKISSTCLSLPAISVLYCRTNPKFMGLSMLLVIKISHLVLWEPSQEERSLMFHLKKD
jgi:hypothetical protein